MELGADRLLRIIIPFLILGVCASIDKLRVLYSWKTMKFAFLSEHEKETAIRDGRFIDGASIPIDMDFYFKAKGSTVFITIPRFQNGIPVTLGYVTNNAEDGQHLIAPYPNWEWNKLGNCDAITSVFRIQVDSCERLWVLDTGKLGNRQLCRPQLLSFSLQTNKLLTRYKFPKEQFKDDSLFVALTVDIRDSGVGDKCRDTFVYIADVTGFALIVYDHQNSHSWKINNKLFFPYPPHGTYHISGHTYDLMDGIIGLALSPVKENGDRILYFHSMASRVESWVPTSVIRNYSLFRDDSESEPRSFRSFAMERSSQSVAQAMDQNGILFFGLLSDLAIGCWNSIKYPEYGGTNTEIVVVNPETLQFPSGIKIIIPNNNREELWILTSSFNKFMTDSLHKNETNFRIQAGYVDELIRGTKCSAQPRFLQNSAYESLQFVK
ncbi:protein yellow-like [Odontomachus brunneus]|uniref:protein yellow-like n=1 Tax=Odontomachus brunneus TaxID=486640 RepID=UPI0013F24E2D|nr:protein yellow-like [Odontomachus brunneus]